MKLRTIAAFTALLALTVTQAAVAQDALSAFALGHQAYNESASKCSYAPVAGQTLAKVVEISSQTDPYGWEKARRATKFTPEVMMNLMPSIGYGSSPCALYGSMVADALMFAQLYVGLSQPLTEEIERLRSLPKDPVPSPQEPAVEVSDATEDSQKPLRGWSWPERLKNDIDNGCLVTKPIDGHKSFAVYANSTEGFGIGLLIPGEMLEVGEAITGAATFDGGPPILLHGTALNGDTFILDSGAEEDSVQSVLGTSQSLKLTVERTSVEIILDGYSQAIDRLWQCAEAR